MSTGFITVQVPTTNDYTEKNFELVGLNTGNVVFTNAIKSLFKCEIIDFSEVENTEYDNYITTFFIWIRENEDKSNFRELVLNKVKDKRVIPISVGLQCREYNPEFKLHANTVTVLQEMAERCTLGVRGEYTASILEKNDIKNIQVVGCPSLYSTLDSNFRMDIVRNSTPQKMACNYKTLLDSISERDFEILEYFDSNSKIFIDQTKMMISDKKYNEMSNSIRNLIEQKRQVFFTLKAWSDFIKNCDFSIGARFHGNVVAILNKVPSLVLSCDSRTKELSDFFSIPNIDIREFDTSKPIEYYYEKADYEVFNKKYSILFNNFTEFAKKNGLELTF